MILSIVSIGGLCNRMRSMAGVIQLAKEWNSNVIFVWIAMPDMNAPFKTLFKDFPFKVVEVTGRRSLFKFFDVVKRCFPGIVIDDGLVYKHFKGEDRGMLFRKKIKGKNLLVFTCENITDSKDFSMFHPSDIVEGFKDPYIDKNTIGIHIRRTDNVKSIQYSPTWLFVERMKEELKRNSKTTFYLATDDPDEEQLICNTFQNKVIIYKKRSLERNDPRGIIDAMVDLVNLSNCRHILGSYYSSFSEVAADWGKIERTVIIR